VYFPDVLGCELLNDDRMHGLLLVFAARTATRDGQSGSADLHATEPGPDRRHPKVPMLGGTFAVLATARRWWRAKLRVQAGALTTTTGSGSDARSLEAPIVQMTDG
jgi:hypothetical protein